MPNRTVAQQDGYAHWGSPWIVEEVGGWRGTWNRRFSSPTFDAVYQAPNGARETATISMRMVGNAITATRDQLTPKRPGMQCEYRGTLAADRKSAAGTYGCTWATGTFPWSAQISNVGAPPPTSGSTVPGSDHSSRFLGQEWQVMDDGIWTGTWTRIGTTDTFRYLYRGPQGQSDNGIVKITGVHLDANSIPRYSLERVSQVNGVKCVYGGAAYGTQTYGGPGMTVGGDVRCSDASGRPQQARWHAMMRK